MRDWCSARSSTSLPPTGGWSLHPSGPHPVAARKRRPSRFPARLSLSLRRHLSPAPIRVPPPDPPARRKFHHIYHIVMHLWVPTSCLFFFAVEVTAIAFKFQVASIRFEMPRVWIDNGFSLFPSALRQQPSGSRLLCWNYEVCTLEGNSLLRKKPRSQFASLHDTTFACHDPVGLTAPSCLRSKTMKDRFIGRIFSAKAHTSGSPAESSVTRGSGSSSLSKSFYSRASKPF